MNVYSFQALEEIATPRTHQDERTALYKFGK